MTIWLIYAGLGSIAGLLAGLLGVGGGIIIVPMLTWTFAALRLPAELSHHLALGTSMGTIVFTSISSFRSHHSKGMVDWDVVRSISPGILLGTFGGTWLAALISGRLLSGLFVLFLFYVALQMLLDIKPKPGRQLPGRMGLSLVGGGIGIISSLVGIGGGSMSVPFLAWCNIGIYTAIGTSAAIGFPIALAGAAGYIINGWSAVNLPPHSLGFVYLPAMTGIAVASYLTAPLGVKLAHRLPVSSLKKIFACMLIVTGIKMLSRLIS